MTRRLLVRIILDILIAVSILQGWWVIALLFGLFGVWYFPYFIEIIAAGIVYDSLFNHVLGMGLRSHSGLIVSVIIFAVVAWGKGVVRK